MRYVAPLTGALLALAALAAAAPGAGDLERLAVNQWTAVYDRPPGIIPVHARFVWLDKMKTGLIWPNLNYRARAVSLEQHALIHLFDPAAGTWTARASTFPKGLAVDPEVIGQSCVYLRGLGKVLVLQTGGSRRLRKHARSWLLDPAKAAWEALLDEPRMCDLSSDFNPARGADGASVPLWGALVYAGGTGEAVAIGGGGTWGRVGRQAEPVQAGDWVYDEAARPKRIRRLTADDTGKVSEARKWYPANCGTWTFSEKDRKWRPVAQPMTEQPPGRVLPGAAYDPAGGQIVLFGGDNYQRCLRDTWIYDCRKRTWRQVKPAAAPPARAGHAMVAVPDQGVVLLAGGYGPGWVPRKDVWAYRAARNEWTRLAMDLPTPATYCSADRDPASGAVLVSPSNPVWGRNKRTVLWGTKLDFSTAPVAAPSKPGDAKLDYHCKHGRWSAPLPEEWSAPANRPGDPEAGRKELAALPPNTWVHRTPPMKVRARQWGKYVYDARTHKGYAWGGGHFGYIGAEVSEYDVLTNRWRSMDDPVNYKLLWRHPAAGGSPGVSFQGWRLMGTHARKSYAVDVLSTSVLTLHGDVFSIAHNRFVANIGRAAANVSPSGQESFVATPHGVYAYHVPRGARRGVIHRAHVAAGKWERLAEGGPAGHGEYDVLCHDAKRDRLVYVKHKTAAVWTFDFKAKKWARDEPAGKAPASVAGDSTYVGDMDAVMFVLAAGKGRPKLYFYKLAEKRWYAAPYQGAEVGWYGNLNNSPCYDGELKLVVRLTHFSRERFVEVVVMRLDPEALDLTPIE